MSVKQKNKTEPTKINAGHAELKSDRKVELHLSRRKKRRKTGW